MAAWHPEPGSMLPISAFCKQEGCFRVPPWFDQNPIGPSGVVWELARCDTDEARTIGNGRKPSNG